MNDKEPYRATKLWNEVIAAFHSGMPVKKHRRRIQTFHDCFAGSDAVTWLHCYLMNNPNFGPNVTRLQSVNLLQKFLKCHVIESAIVKSKKKEFLDDSHLYKFTSMLCHSKPSALCLVQSPLINRTKSGKEKLNNIHQISPHSSHLQKENLPECHLVERKLSSKEIKTIYEKVILNRLEALLPHISFTELVDSKLIDGNLIKYNIFRLSKTGVVCLIDKTEDIPHWVISAMKCLANWPNASGSGSCLPNYPGFEKDVFKVVRDFFINPQVPLIPAFVTSLLLKAYNNFVQDLGKDCNNTVETKFSDSVNSKSSRVSHISSADLKTSTPLNNDTTFKNSRVDLNATLEGKMLLDDPEVMWEYPSVVYFETDFATTQPVTRVISNQSTNRSRSSSYVSFVGSMESVSTISVCSVGQKSLSSISSDFKTKSSLKAWSSNMYLQDETKENPQWLNTATEFSHMNLNSSSLKACKGSENLCNSFTSYPGEPFQYMCEVNDLDTSNISSKTITESMEYIELPNFNSQDSCYSFHAKCSKSFSSPSEQIKCNNHSMQYEAKFIKDNIYSEDLKSSFQLILLLMPSANRRQLHLLLRLINKILKNGKFVVNTSISIRHFLLETFLPAIIQTVDISVHRLYQMVAFLLDYCETLFQPPLGLKEEALEICRYSSGKIRFTVDDTCFLTYCEMVSKQQYEEQKVVSSIQALKGLLNSILQDKNMSERERKKKLKQFKNSHPDIYMMQFPEKPEPSSKQKNSFFNKLVNLRM